MFNVTLTLKPTCHVEDSQPARHAAQLCTQPAVDAAQLKKKATLVHPCGVVLDVGIRGLMDVQGNSDCAMLRLRLQSHTYLAQSKFQLPAARECARAGLSRQ